MAEKIEHIGKRDVAWSYAATIFMVGAGVLLLPFILNKMSAETVGIWGIFQTITMLVLLLDFGFRPTFARNISYIFSGVKALKREGVEHTDADAQVDYGLLKGSLIAMRKFYTWISLSVLAILLTIGSAYFYYILQKYSGDKQDAMVAWILLIVINCYNLYTLYYDALLTGKGYIKRSQQITMLGQGIYIGLAIVLIYSGLGLTAIVSAQLISTIIRRVLAYKVFFTPELKESLSTAIAKEPKEILSAITPNAVKIGLTYLGAFCITKSATLVGSIFISLEDVAIFGITMQVMDVLTRCGQVVYIAYTPRLAQCRVEHNIPQLRRYYIYSVSILISVFFIGGVMWVNFGDVALRLIGSQTPFLPTAMLITSIVINFLESNHALAAGFIMADNRIPFFIPSLLSGLATLVLLFIFLYPMHWGLWGMVLAPGVAQLAYQNWKWPMMLIRELKDS